QILRPGTSLRRDFFRCHAGRPLPFRSRPSQEAEFPQQLVSAGWPAEDREFTGHLTLCRVKNPKAGAKLSAMIEHYKDFKLGIMAAESVRVYQSQLTLSGPIYTVLGKYKLNFKCKT
ncbi:MAG: hypothetical protein MUP16_10055, partial [Sedimentisphaerales bacterium]|nr:hypothetical protein [Sedimentisphaerales bacterium]